MVEDLLPDVLHDVLATPQLREMAGGVVVETLKQHLGRGNGTDHCDVIKCNNHA